MDVLPAMNKGIPLLGADYDGGLISALYLSAFCNEIHFIVGHNYGNSYSTSSAKHLTLVIWRLRLNIVWKQNCLFA